ncbi:nucleotidyl transferase AbiEii/AbiGii toxin family protein [Jeotgalibacillus terrae]|uniref:Nucleotidyl transferase AbiEii/AbiGii toxin family protein n=1 Tax=Jeotgalibacillus terrae TaxID=587735 RepID=A0ABW5ZJE3_9BACL|nr:nucleotidyl transferase AbiEii/AbiGii toxin family protein [Jeotgalibacillus terrae]MBM7580811.1 hypothetical protein [Jeotgalibacillus terrae]
MNLHEDKEAFLEIIAATPEDTGIPEEQVEKDYFVSYVLEFLVGEVPTLVFKGGTSLSKCYGVIKRFSEDIDLNYTANDKPTQSQKKAFKEGIIVGIEKAGLTLLNESNIRSRRDHNEYEVSYPQQVDSYDGFIRKELLVETFIAIKSFPCERMPASSYILEFLKREEQLDIIQQYDLKEFELNVQRIDRTFIDKLFAICDYYEEKKFHRYSRHLYDLHSIWTYTEFIKKEFQTLFHQVRAERKNSERNTSSQDGYDLIQTLRVIVDQDVYKKDYNDITSTLLFEEVSYGEVIRSIREILSSDLIPTS